MTRDQARQVARAHGGRSYRDAYGQPVAAWRGPDGRVWETYTGTTASIYRDADAWRQRKAEIVGAMIG